MRAGSGQELKLSPVSPGERGEVWARKSLRSVPVPRPEKQPCKVATPVAPRGREKCLTLPLPSSGLGGHFPRDEDSSPLLPPRSGDLGKEGVQTSRWSIEAESVEKVQFPSHTPRQVSGFRPLGTGLRSASFLAPVTFTSFDSHLCTFLFKKPFQARSAPSAYTLTASSLNCRQGTQEPNPVPPHLKSRRKHETRDLGSSNQKKVLYPSVRYCVLLIPHTS